MSYSLFDISISIYSHQYVNQCIKFRAVVGYLGTIEMPVAPGDTGAVDESAMRSCIRRLRLEKRVHTRENGIKIVCLGTPTLMQ